MTELDVLDHMRAHGVATTDHLVPDGHIHRFRVEGSRNKNGWAWFIERDGRWFGVYGDWAAGTTVKLGANTLTFRQHIRAQHDVANAAAAHAAARGQEEWSRLALVGVSAYLDRKGVPAYGVRFGPGFIAVPMYANDEMVGLQKIYDDGHKRFTFGCTTKGAATHIPGSMPIVICEGYATAASIHMATEYRVVIAFNAGNLMSVAQAVRKANWREPILIAADDDRATLCPGHKEAGEYMDPTDKTRPKWCVCNPGVTAAMAAARASKSGVVRPHGMNGTDFNDLMLERGTHEVHLQLIDAL